MPYFVRRQKLYSTHVLRSCYGLESNRVIINPHSPHLELQRSIFVAPDKGRETVVTGEASRMCTD